MDQRPVVMITGASRGIGHATAEIFGENGYDVVMLARRTDVLERAAASDHQPTPSLGRVASRLQGREAHVVVSRSFEQTKGVRS